MWFPLALLSALAFSALWILARMSRGMPSSVVTAVQFVAAPFLLVYASSTIDYPWGAAWWQAYLVFPLLLIPLTQWAMTYAVHRTEVTLLKPLFGISSIVTLAVAVFLFGERVSPRGILGLLLITAGLLCLYTGRWSVWGHRGPWIALTGAIVFGINAAIVHAVLSRFPSVLGIAAMAMTGSLIINAIPAAPALRRVRWTVGNVAIMGGLLIAFLIQDLGTITAFQFGPSSYVIAVKRTSILLTAIVGYLFLGERDQSLPRLLLACSLVVAGVGTLATG